MLIELILFDTNHTKIILSKSKQKEFEMKKFGKTILTFALALIMLVPVLCIMGCKKDSNPTLVLDKMEIYFQAEPDIRTYSKVKIGALSGSIDGNEAVLDENAKTEYDFWQKRSGVVTTYTKENPLVLTTGSISVEPNSTFTLTLNSPKVMLVESGFGTVYNRDAVKIHTFTVPSQEGYSNESLLYEDRSTSGLLIYIRFHFSGK